MFWCLVRLSTGALCGGLYANPLQMAIQSAVTCSEAKDDGLLVSRQLMERVLVWVVSFRSHRYDSTGKNPKGQAGFEPRIYRS